MTKFIVYATKSVDVLAIVKAKSAELAWDKAENLADEYWEECEGTECIEIYDVDKEDDNDKEV